jgi:predicted secreted hydrolase
MANIIYTDGIGIPHGSFEKEFLAHPKCSEWWYATGYAEDGEKNLFGYQFTLAKVKLSGVKFHILICTVTDFQTQKHYNVQGPILFAKGITTTANFISVDNKASFTFAPNAHSSLGSMKLHMEGGEFCIDLSLEATKAPVWQCDDGVLQMGILNDPKQRTYYWSFTNIAVTGKLTLLGKVYKDITGKGWFDRQGGTYSLANPKCNWEWFSLRFFDNREAMLFAFPQDDYYDGTYIEADGSYRRMNDYKVEATDVITYEGKQYSSRWKLEMNSRHYTIIPRMDGMFNIYFFELLADVVDDDGNIVAYCVVELLPGVRNESRAFDAFRKKS